MNDSLFHLLIAALLLPLLLVVDLLLQLIQSLLQIVHLDLVHLENLSVLPYLVLHPPHLLILLPQGVLVLGNHLLLLN